MEIKNKFDLLVNVDNVLNFSDSKLSRVSIIDGQNKIYNTLSLVKNRIDHFTKKRVFKVLTESRKKKKAKIVILANISNYILPVTYNKPSNSIIINLHSFGSDDISRIDPRNIYACMVYGICFKELATKKSKIPYSTFSPITAFITTTLMKLFGKEFGLLGIYSTQIPVLKFLTACYVISSMFGVESKSKLYSDAAAASTVDFRPLVDDLVKYDFSNINNYIKALSEFKVMPGITRHTFAAKFVKTLSVNFLPALEDCSRFISTITTSGLPGTSVVPTFISKYNRIEFEKILAISKKIFK